ncbi:MAG: sulfatase-like hydrolase/transferase [Puniceicoccaceae bacterium]
MKYLITLLLFAAFSLHAKVQPNILWLLTDDQRADSIACYNRATTGKAESPLGYVESPNVDKLAEQGVLFTSAFCQAAGCAPSRISMHSGRYPHRSGVYGFEPHHHYASHWKPQLPQQLEKAGYQTIHAGKLGVRTLGWDGKRWDWSKASKYQVDFNFKSEFWGNNLTGWKKYPAKKGDVAYTDEFFVFPDGRVENVVLDRELTKEEKIQRERIENELDILRHYNPGEAPGPLIIAGVSPQPGEAMRDARYAEAISLHLANADKDYTTLWGSQQMGPDSDSPVFVHVGFDFPHTPVIPPKDYRERFSNYTYKIPEFTKEEMSKLPPQLVKLIKAKYTDHFSDEDKLKMIQDYHAFCAWGDSVIGNLVDDFKSYSDKQGRPWMIIYVCGDHGWNLNDHGKISKFSPWDICLRTPVIVVSSDKKAFPAGKVVTEITELVDIAPTALSAAGIDISKSEFDYLDGRDLKQVAAGKVKRDYAIGESNHVIGHRAFIRNEQFSFSMKTRPHKTAGKDFKWAINAGRDEVELALYDLRVDPNETNNVANDRKYRKLADWMRLKLQSIIIGDGRHEVKWDAGKEAKVYSSNFAPGADDKKLDIPKKLVPKVQ